ncbi:MAG: MgtC/SapB family protein [Candidatus Methanoperedens sp.]|nr:MgtC/SapB family protein [Candidatus Methanoperedens sp.]MCZ7395792.1 MgtC/SapB family protein [Candidatus Methanoperedens sp.]
MIDLVPQSFGNTEANIVFFQKLALAALIGILIGIEREHRRPEAMELIAGVRSFTIACIAGMISSYLAQIINPGILLISLAFFAVIATIYVYIKNVTLKQPGVTGPIAFYCTFLLGILINYELYLVAIVGAVVLTLLLAEKRPLHSFATNLTDDEILSGTRFLAVVFILYPITPDEWFMGVINPRTILLIVIIVATLSFISFVVMKKMGTKRGIPLSGLLGGLVNSEATTGALAAMAKKRSELIESSFVGIILSNAAMLIRNLVIAFIVDPSGRVLYFMALPQLLITLFAVAAVIKSRNIKPVSETIQLQSPFALSPAIKFALGFTALSVVSSIANHRAGVAGVYATALGGFISSAVVTASAAALAVHGDVSYTTAAITAVLASIISTGNKMLLVKWSGPSELVGMINKTFARFIIFGAVVLIIWGIFINYTY